MSADVSELRALLDEWANNDWPENHQVGGIILRALPDLLDRLERAEAERDEALARLAKVEALADQLLAVGRVVGNDVVGRSWVVDELAAALASKAGERDE